MTKTVWPAKLKYVFTVWPFTESVCQLLLLKRAGLVGTSCRKADCEIVCEVFCLFVFK